MKMQVLHILKNNLRRFWREVVLMFAIMAAYGWRATAHSHAVGFFLTRSDLSSQILSLLVFLSLIFLIVRTVHAEPLVGDRQFWVTRPYDWRQLLSEKVLFVVVFVNLPVFILQAFLLWRAGFWPPHYLAGLLRMQLYWTFFVTLPIASLAVVTGSIGQFVMAVLGVLLYLPLFAVLLGKIPNIGVAGADEIPIKITAVVVYGVIIAIIFWQYARRRTAHSRVVLLGMGVAIPLLFGVMPYRTIIFHTYPAPNPAGQLPVHLAFDHAKPASLNGGYFERNKVHITLPLLVSGIAEGSEVVLSGLNVSIKAPGGLRWNSGWHGQGQELLAHRSHTSEIFALDRDFFDRVKSIPVTIQLTFAITPARATDVERIVAGPGLFTLPGDGECYFSPLSHDQPVCVFPPEPDSQTMLLSVQSGEIACKPGENEKPLPAGIIAYGRVWRADSFGLNPVSTRTLKLYDFGELKVPHSRETVCPGTPLTVYSGWRYGTRFRTDLEIDDIYLADYKLNDSPDEGGRFGMSGP